MSSSARDRSTARETDGLPQRLEAFGRVFEAHHAQVASYLWRRTGDPDASEELASETFLRAWRNRDQFRGEVPVLHWLLGIATHAVHAHLRRRRLEETVLDLVARSRAFIGGDPREPSREVSAVDELAFVRRAIQRLSLRQQDVLSLHGLEGLRTAEIASLLGVAEGTVKSRLSRAREALRIELSRERTRELARAQLALEDGA